MKIMKLLSLVKNKGYVFAFILLTLSSIFFFSNTHLVLNIDANGRAKAELYYTTPVYNHYDKEDIIHFTIDDKQPIYNIKLSKKLIYIIKLKIYDYYDVFSFKINSAYIKLPFFKQDNIYLMSYQNNIVTAKEIHANKGILTFSKISYYILIIPFTALIIMIISALYLFQNNIIYLINILNKPVKENIIFIGMIIFIILFEAFKIVGMGSEYNKYTEFYMFLYIIKEDSYFLSIFLLLFYTAVQIKNKYISSAVLCVIIFGISILMLDIALINLFSIRFRIGEGAGFMLDTSIIIKIGLSFFMTKAGIYSLLLFVYVCLFSFFIIRKKNRYSFSKKEKTAIFIMIVAFIPLFLIDMEKTHSGSTALQESIVNANISNSEKILYSSDKIADTLKHFKFKYTCVDGLNSKKNIIIVIMESVSSYKSRLFSNMDDRIPYIDSIGREHIYAKNYYCSNYNSNQNIFSILTGYPLITSVKDDRREILSYYSHSFIKEFQKNGYDVEMYSAVDNNFDGINKIARNAGIVHIYDANSSIFNHIKKRYLFNGIEDRQLYNTVYEKIYKKNNPFMVIITTMSTHGPYIDPETSELSYDKTLEYADKSLKEFTEKLNKSGFFNNGILVVTSDHRAMLPVTEEEKAVLGEFAHSAIPLAVIDGSIKKEIKGIYAHTDLGKSIEYLALNKACFNQFQRNIFNDANYNGKNCIIHQQGVDFTLIDVKCNNTYGQIFLDGDNTRFIKDELSISDEYKKEIINYINYLRIIK